MGLLSLGTPLPWEEAKKYVDHVRKNGIEQFINVWRQAKEAKSEPFVWGDELEYIIVRFNHQDRSTQISLNGAKSIQILQEEEIKAQVHAANGSTGCPPETLWRPEYGAFMLEATPGTPYDSSLQDLLTVEPNMRLRRLKAKHTLADNEEPLPIGSYPLLGVPGFVESSHKPLGPVLRSLFLPDSVMYPHPRFGTLSGNIRKRRGSKVQINIPIFHDTNTPQPFIDPDVAREGKLGHIDQCDQGAALDDHIYMDAMGFGMGCCCIQMTLQAGNVQSARKLFDHLAPLGAILMALSASTPCYRGYLSDIDCRWDVIGASVDCRTRQERGLEPLTTDRYVIPKSRYGTIDAFLSSDDGHFKDEYNDLGLVYNEEAYKRLRESGVDFNLARHIAHLFIRDPIVIFEELLDQDNTKSSDHFENIQSTNWQNVRFKPPSPDSATGWRVEFRTGEIQFTDFENAALAVFVNLLGRAILAFNLNFYIPVTRMDVNMARAHRRDAVNSAKFYFRKQVFPVSSSPLSDTATDAVASVAANGHGCHARENGNASSSNNSSGASHVAANGVPKRVAQPVSSSVEDEYTEMSIDEIINGRNGGFVGLIPIVLRYLDSVEADGITRTKLMRYIKLISLRASGALMTNAAWIRNFVRNHPKYKGNSVVTSEINYDLMQAIKDITNGVSRVPELFGELC